MLVLVTRPRIDAERTSEKLVALGHEALIDPVIEIEPLPFEVPQGLYDNFVPLVFTSANGVRMFVSRVSINTYRSFRVFAVGGRTAEAAREGGFQNVEIADGDVNALAVLLAERLAPSSRVLHLAGEDRAGDLPGMLAAREIRVEVLQVYKARAASTLSAETISAFRQKKIGAALHYSERSAAVFLNLADVSGLRAAVLQARHVCISQAAAKPLADFGAKTDVALAPTEAAVLEALSR